MSFINPAFAPKTKSYHVTSADLLNAIVIPEAEYLFFNLFTKGNVGYDGEVVFEQKLEDGTWSIICSGAVGGGANKDAVTGLASKSAGNYFSNTTGTGTVYPFIIRARIAIKATVGSCDIRIDYL